MALEDNLTLALLVGLFYGTRLHKNESEVHRGFD